MSQYHHRPSRFPCLYCNGVGLQTVGTISIHSYQEGTIFSMPSLAALLNHYLIKYKLWGILRYYDSYIFYQNICLLAIHIRQYQLGPRRHIMMKTALFGIICLQTALALTPFQALVEEWEVRSEIQY